MQWTAHTSEGFLENGCEQYYFLIDDCGSILHALFILQGKE